MKQIVTGAITTLLLLSSTASIAFDTLPERDQRRIHNESHDMMQVLNLSDEQYRGIRQIKADLNKANNQLVRDHGRNTDAYREARKPHWAAYQKGLFQIITREELRRYNESKK